MNDSDNLQRYLKELSQIRLLTLKEERALAAKMHGGDKAAKEHMIKANLRLVVKIARDYEGLGLPLLDLISEGNLGLVKGIERFDPARGAKISTYASCWIKQMIKRALANQSKTIRLPVHVHDQVCAMRRVANRLYGTLGHEPSDVELAEEMGVSVKRIATGQAAAVATVSLDQVIDGETGRILSSIVEDTSAIMPAEMLARKENVLCIKEAFGCLTEREAAILIMRFGLDGGNGQTLERIGRTFKLTRERIRQIESRALKKLRLRMKRLEIELALPLVLLQFFRSSRANGCAGMNGHRAMADRR